MRLWRTFKKQLHTQRYNIKWLKGRTDAWGRQKGEDGKEWIKEKNGLRKRKRKGSKKVREDRDKNNE